MAAKTGAQALPVKAPEAAFAITATRPTRPPRTLKYGDTFLVLDGRGDIASPLGGSAGLFHLDTRYLSRLELLVDGMQPLLLGSNLRDDNLAFFVDLTNPDLMSDRTVVLEKDTVHILRTIFVWRGTAYQRLASLDSESEEAIREALGRLMRGRTVIAIAHRLSTVRSFDRIVVLQLGTVVQDGPPNILAHREGLYRRLVQREMDRPVSQPAA